MNEIVRPALRWHGGKWMLAPWIISHFAPHRIYVEPFGGAASVLLRKPRAYAEIYNDLDDQVVNFFRVARDRGDELARALDLTPFARSEFDLSYSSTDDNLENARRLVVRSFMGFGSNVQKPTNLGRPMRTGFRANSNRSGSTPAQDWRNYPEAFRALIERLQGVVIEKRPAITVMKSHDAAAALHYVDPPYVASTRGDAFADYAHELTDTDHEHLLRALCELQGMVLLSGYRCPLYDAALQGWVRVEQQTYADGARVRTECLWLNPSLQAALTRRQPSLFDDDSHAFAESRA
jgi:DNA adenine methylase